MKDVVREFRLLLSLKRAGKTSTSGIHPGDLVFPCPTCARPGVNLPDNWETRDKGFVDFSMSRRVPSRLTFRHFSRLLNMVGFAIDGNFQLHSFTKGGGPEKDPSLFQDWGFWAVGADVEKHVSYHQDKSSQRKQVRFLWTLEAPADEQCDRIPIAHPSKLVIHSEQNLREGVDAPE